ncbi:cardiotrophin-1 isoform X2 [Alligator mississippiensis]|nr:cardiotrophin-1 isoform X2 [Alligator mississippiensis]
MLRQAESLSLLLQHSAEQLLADYVRHQGDPFSTPSFHPPAPLGLPPPPRPPGGDAERLAGLAAAYAALPGLLGSVRAQQAQLNPGAAELLRGLEAGARQARGLAGHIEAVAAELGVALPGPWVPPDAHPPANAFGAKVWGYWVCRLHRDWARRAHEDLGLLARRYPL